MEEILEVSTNENVKNIQAPREYKDERFEFALFVNDKLICKRNFRINNYINQSMQSLDFKETVDGIVEMIDNDLKSKSRVATWFYATSPTPFEEYHTELAEPWEVTFKFVVSDNHVPVIEKIWDGRGYPRIVRDRVDITNKSVRIVGKNGQTYTYDKETYFKDNADKLPIDMYILKAMINDKQDLLMAITRKICEACSPRENGYKATSDYVLKDVYKNKVLVLNEDGTQKVDKNGKKMWKVDHDTSKKYFYSLEHAKEKYYQEWRTAVSSKTKDYVSTLY